MANLIMGGGARHAVSAIDEAVVRHIEAAPSGDYSPALAKDKTWSTFFHLSDMRRSLLDWYDFGESSSLLEVGGGMGALTGLFCERCALVTTVERNLPRARAIRQRYEAFPNLTVVVADVEQYDFGQQFDVIIMVGVLAAQPDPAAFLAAVLRWLKPGGHLLLTAENRFGVNALCGVPEPDSGMPFASVREDAGRGFTRSSLADLLHHVGLTRQKFFYPSPDYVIAKSVFTDDYLPDRKSISGSLPYVTNPSTLVASPQALCLEAAANGGFAFVANSFLVECAYTDSLSQAIFSVSSTNHPSYCRYATTMYAGGTVEKVPLHSDSIPSVAHLGENLRELADRGLPVVPFEQQGDKMVMPCMAYPTLFAHLEMLVRRGNSEAVVKIYDQLYAHILQSSSQVPAKENAFPGTVSGIDYGPILSKAYLEMVPLNCFWVDDDCLFYDQELTERNYPAQYVLFRAICHSPAYFYPEMQRQLKNHYRLEDVWDTFWTREQTLGKERVGQDKEGNFAHWRQIPWGDLWSNANRLLEGHQSAANVLQMRGLCRVVVYGYEYEGRMFCEELRKAGLEIAGIIEPNALQLAEKNPEVVFFLPGEWPEDVDVLVVTRPDDGTQSAEDIVEDLPNLLPCPVVTMSELHRAAELPSSGEAEREEIREGVVITAQVKRLWAVQLELLRQFMAVCDKYGLRYYAMNGTLLGAVRHGGFVPWDDDIDMAMPREDLEKLKEVAAQEFAYPYFLQTPEEEPYLLEAFTRLRNSETLHVWEPFDEWTSGNKGCYIDILALDGTWSTLEKQQRHNKEVLFFRQMLRKTSPYVDYDPAFVPSETREPGLFAPHREPAELQRKIKQASTRLGTDEAEYWAILGRSRLNAFDKQAFGKVEWMDFEDLKIPVPEGYGEIMAVLWESIDIPPEALRTQKHAGRIDTYTSYRNRDINRFNNVFYQVEGKRFLIFGTGSVLDTYMKNHGKKYCPAAIFDKDPARWGNKVFNITIRDPAELPGMMGGDTRLIITDKAYKIITRQLIAIGVAKRDIYIYTEGRLYK